MTIRNETLNVIRQHPFTVDQAKIMDKDIEKILKMVFYKLEQFWLLIWQH